MTDIILLIFSLIGSITFIYWWLKHGKATIVYIYVTVILLGIFVDKVFDLSYSEVDLSFENLLLALSVSVLVIHMVIRIIRSNSKIQKLKNETRSKADLNTYARKVLVVEDDYQIPNLLKEYFEAVRPAIKMEYCSGGQEAVDFILKNKDIDIFILDIHLGGKINGFELCSFIKKQVKRGIIIAITGFPIKYSFDEARKRGFDDYFIKPFRLSDIDKTLAHYCECIDRWERTLARLEEKVTY